MFCIKYRIIYLGTKVKTPTSFAWSCTSVENRKFCSSGLTSIIQHILYCMMHVQTNKHCKIVFSIANWSALVQPASLRNMTRDGGRRLDHRFDPMVSPRDIRSLIFPYTVFQRIKSHVSLQ